MGANTKIETFDATWNPVTGCLHGCEYCYARGFANRYCGFNPTPGISNGAWNRIQYVKDGPRLGVLNEAQHRIQKNGMIAKAAYPFGFTPTLHRYRLDIPKHWKKPRTIFVCSMADLFGDWVPDDWIQEVFKACEAAPRHRYLFLTKNPARYKRLSDNEILINKSNFWYGTTVTNPDQKFFCETPFFTNKVRSHSYGIFLSIEPIQADFPVEKRFARQEGQQPCIDWMIVGAETGNRREKIVPKREWIEHLAETSKLTGVPLFMKKSLRGIMGDGFMQEFPWD